jgi:hypothetical protein
MADEERNDAERLAAEWSRPHPAAGAVAAVHDDSAP